MGKHIMGSPHEETVGTPSENPTGQMGHPGKQQSIKGSPSQVPQLGKDTFLDKSPVASVTPTKPV